MRVQLRDTDFVPCYDSPILNSPIKHLSSICLIVSLVTGCQSPTHERVFLSLAPTEKPATKNVRYTGQYRLYTNAARHPTTQNATPILEARLTKGDLLGFTLSETGHLLAVIRTDQKPLPNSSASYAWTMQPDPGQYDPDRTILLVVTILFIGGIAIGITAAATNPWGCSICF